MSTTYLYNKIEDFPNSKIDLGTLESSITSAGLSAALSYITVDEDDCSIVFELDLSVEDKTTLDSIVGLHTGVCSTDEVTPIFVGSSPDPGIKFWLRPENNVVYCFDDVRSKWLSTNRNIYSFARKGNAKGMYIPLLGDLDAVDDVYMPGKDSVIVSVFCKSCSGDETKEFEIRKNGIAIFTFSYDGSDSLIYSNNDLDLNVDASDTIQVFVTKSGGNVMNTICRVETAWRYDNE